MRIQRVWIVVGVSGVALAGLIAFILSSYRSDLAAAERLAPLLEHPAEVGRVGEVEVAFLDVLGAGGRAVSEGETGNEQRAAGAADLLARARVAASVDEAIGDCGLVLGATARPRSKPRARSGRARGATPATSA